MTATSPTPVRPVRGRIARAGWFAGGWVAVGIGSIGMVLPGLPTTVFFIVAAWCFGKSSPRFERWVLGLPKIGPMVRDHRDGLGMPRRAKVIAIGSMWTAIGISAVLLRNHVAIVIVVVALGLVGAGYIVWRVPLRERVLAEART
jgi:uncharacterized membrane protein YbaN (DUF454 family)